MELELFKNKDGILTTVDLPVVKTKSGRNAYKIYPAWNKGKKTPPEIRQKLSEANKGKPSGNKGKTHSPETLLKISESLKGKTPWNKGLKKQKPPKPAKIPKPPKPIKVSLKNGEAQRGEQHRLNTTPEAVARQIKTDLLYGMRLCDIVRKYNVTKSVVSNIKHGYSWKWLQIP